MTVVAAMTVRRGRFELSIDLAGADGQVIAVLGRNGAGKSTLLAALGGLLPISDGTISVDGVEVSRPGFTLSPERRRVGLLGQQPMLFPHLSALENVAFGPRAAGVPRASARKSAAALLAAVGVAEHAGRRPAQLSGGQQQRVALARALAAKPRVLLLDEPLAALDIQTAVEIRHLLRSTLRDASLTSIVVTHEVLDAVVIADRLLVLADGRVVADGSPAQVLAAPTDPFVAALAGVNLVMGTVVGGAVRAADGRTISGLPASPLVEGLPGAAVFAPSAVALYLADPHGSPRNHWPATVLGVEPGPSTARVRLSGEPNLIAELTPAAVADLQLSTGSAVWVSVKATEVALHGR